MRKINNKSLQPPKITCGIYSVSFHCWTGLSLSGIATYSQASKSKLSCVFTCPQIFIVYIIILEQKGIMQMKMSNCDIFVKLSRLDTCKPTRLHHSNSRSWPPWNSVLSKTKANSIYSICDIIDSAPRHLHEAATLNISRINNYIDTDTILGTVA